MSDNPPDNNTYHWTAFPMRESPLKGIFFWMVVIFTIWAIHWNIGSVMLTFVAAVILLGALTSFFLPTTYILDESGAGFKRWFHRRRLSWSKVRSVVDERDGMFLSPFPVKSRLENFRGLYLPYRNNRERVLAVVKFYAPEAGGFPKSLTDDDDVNSDNDASNMESGLDK